MTDCRYDADCSQRGRTRSPGPPPSPRPPRPPQHRQLWPLTWYEYGESSKLIIGLFIMKQYKRQNCRLDHWTRNCDKDQWEVISSGQSRQVTEVQYLLETVIEKTANERQNWTDFPSNGKLNFSFYNETSVAPILVLQKMIEKKENDCQHFGWMTLTYEEEEK